MQIVQENVGMEPVLRKITSVEENVPESHVVIYSVSILVNICFQRIWDTFG